MATSQVSEEILTWLGKNQQLTTSQLCCLFGSSMQMTRRWLRELVTQGLVSKQKRLQTSRGRREDVLFLSPKGLRQVASASRIKLPKNRKHIHEMSEHALAINDFRVLLESLPDEFSTECFSSLSLLKNESEWNFLRFEVPIAPESETTKTLLPDAAFLLKNATKTLLFFLEIDRGTEPLQASKEGATDIAEKLDHYRVLRGLNLFKPLEKEACAPLNGFRTLLVSTEQKRHDSLCDFIKLQQFCDFIWLASLPDLKKQGLEAAIWRVGGKKMDKFCEAIDLFQKIEYLRT